MELTQQEQDELDRLIKEQAFRSDKSKSVHTEERDKARALYDLGRAHERQAWESRITRGLKAA